jgi:hypothetical protein
MHKGSCLCGTVRYEIDADIKRITHCHCSMCRKAHGAAFGSYGTVPRGSFRFTDGADAVAAYHSSSSVTRTFCRHCGSTLQWYSDAAHPEWMSIALGTLDTSLEQSKQKHIFAGSKSSWYQINDGLPQSPSGS